MQRMLPRSLVTAVVAVLAMVAAAAIAAGEFASFERDELAIETAAGEAHHFTVELAVTPEQQSQGLMFRRSLPADAGMLFIYPSPRVASFWMRNTLIPLDMLFIAADGSISQIVERAVPLSLTPITSDEPVAAVLELNGGRSARLGIRPGDRVVHPVFERDS